MRLSVIPLTAENIVRCRPIWGDRLLMSSEELDGIVARAALALRLERARGVLLVDECDRARYFAISTFVSHEFAQRIVADPQPRVGFQVLREWSPENPSPILDEPAIAVGNGSENGLVLTVLNQGYDLEGLGESGWPTIVGTVLEQFQFVHRGFRVERLIGEGFGIENDAVITTATPFAKIWRFDLPADTAPVHSIVFTFSRQDVLTHWSPILPVFTYAPPKVRFSRSERTLLRAALAGGTHKEVAARLALSLPAVTARWKRIVSRVSDRAPELLSAAGAARGSSRGEQSKHLILDFVRAHPSELTPWVASSHNRGAERNSTNPRRLIV